MCVCLAPYFTLHESGRAARSRRRRAARIGAIGIFKPTMSKPVVAPLLGLLLLGLLGLLLLPTAQAFAPPLSHRPGRATGGGATAATVVDGSASASLWAAGGAAAVRVAPLFAVWSNPQETEGACMYVGSIGLDRIGLGWGGLDWIGLGRFDFDKHTQTRHLSTRTPQTTSGGSRGRSRPRRRTSRA